MKAKELQPILEAMIFAAPEPVTPAGLAQALDVERHAVESALQELAAACEAPDRGIQLVEMGGGLQFVTKSGYAAQVGRLFPEPAEEGLSRSALETLAIVAYRQPVTRAEIEDIRGVRSERALITLLNQDLIAEVGRREGPGRPILYGTTRAFLEYAGLRDLSELPPLPDA